MGEKTWHLKGRGLNSRIWGCYGLQVCVLCVMEEPPNSPINRQMPAINIMWSFFLNNHKISWVGRNLKRPPIPTPCNKYLQLDQITLNPTQTDLEYFHGWGIHHLSVQPIPAFHHPLCKKIASSYPGLIYPLLA